MLDLKLIRENPEAVQRGLASKGVSLDLQPLIKLDAERRAMLKDVEELKARRNTANNEIARLKKQGKSAETVILEMKTTSQKISEIDQKVGEKAVEIEKKMLMIPNVPLSDVPVAKGAEGNKVVRTWGEPRTFEYKLKDHLDLATGLGWLSMDRGSKITGAGFPVYFGKGAKLERALISFMLDLHVKKHGYTEVWPPSIVNRASMRGTGQLPKMEQDMYKLGDDDQGSGDFFLIPTAEVPITNLLRDELLEEKDLPVKYTGYTPCFRKEAGSYGKDTRGLSRVHQFDKVEMVKFVKPETSGQELEALVRDAEEVLQALELPYRVLLLGTGDMSFAAAKCYDLEAWAPATKKWFEVSSCSVFTDFQARRLNLRYRNAQTQKPEFVHTLNGSGLALARIVLCLLENFQTKDGQVEFPKALQPYLA
ncbi:MAG TPA: serine--tRNA ligase [Candidatus Omnitrophota bacterium]|nr:serine--tRNA ligase [Candidatus Omnitrophota bacterium]HPS36591.1 serine--tRNA ligase [Candidatus Omnitrophota bacterium]